MHRIALVSSLHPLVFALALSCGVFPSLARAHGLPIGGIAPLLHEGEVVGAGTTWGIVLREAEGVRRVCEEGTGAPATRYHRTHEGRILVAGPAGLFATTDGGCTYDVVTEALRDVPIADLAVALQAPETMVLVTERAGEDNGIWRSRDAGLSFERLPWERGGLRFDAVMVDGTGDVIVAIAQDAVTLMDYVVVSTDGGARFVESPDALRDFTYVRLLGPSAAGDELRVVGVLPSALNVVLGSRDGFVTAREIARIDDQVTDYGEAGESEFLTLSRTQLLRRRSPATEFEQVVGPTRCLVRVPQDPRLFGCGVLPDGAHLLATLDGETWTQHVPFLGIEERLCPEETPGYVRCARYLFPDAGPPPDASVEDIAMPPPGGSTPACGCNSLGARGDVLPALVTLVLLGATLRRRSRSRQP